MSKHSITEISFAGSNQSFSVKRPFMLDINKVKKIIAQRPETKIKQSYFNHIIRKNVNQLKRQKRFRQKEQTSFNLFVPAWLILRTRFLNSQRQNSNKQKNIFSKVQISMYYSDSNYILITPEEYGNKSFQNPSQTSLVESKIVE
ncbi:unnamed protein product [Paramecium octaurelia]|uniref:Uncharacterized protein n=1 Tax=Paramecium octaurelia TaxID=43137 RepID=A0A8S1YR97_PAROT|nr:unnamed protein product [Paramecium octaurelia]